MEGSEGKKVRGEGVVKVAHLHLIGGVGVESEGVKGEGERVR